MKAERRQELRTNELAERIDRLSSYIKDNALKIGAAVVGVVVVVASGFGYANWRTNRVIDGWARLADTAGTGDAVSNVDRARAVAEENLSPALTAAAWLRIGEIAARELSPARSPSALIGSKTDDAFWIDTAEKAYRQVLQLAAEDRVAAGRAIMGLAAMAEERKDFADAEAQYRKIIDDARFENLPYRMEAEYRLAGLPERSKPIEFPPPIVPAPTSAPASAPATPDAPAVPTTQLAGDATSRPVAPPADSTADPVDTGDRPTPPAPVPPAAATTNPASDG